MTSLLKLAAICAHMSVAAHCHTYLAGQLVPKKYYGEQRSFYPIKVYKPQDLLWGRDVKVYWNGDTLNVIPIGPDLDHGVIFLKDATNVNLFPKVNWYIKLAGSEYDLWTVNKVFGLSYKKRH